ncbi:hypothetical protein AAFZ21_001665 [Vibrio fluvialis]
MVADTISQSYDLYSKYILDVEKIALLKQHGLKVAGSVPSVIWELFGSVLTGRNSNGVTGADLNGWEVKSAIDGASYEYQYHLNTGEQKLLEDCEVNHLFCSYSDNYEDVTVYALSGKTIAPQYFLKWFPLYKANYDREIPANQRRQRFRRTISYGYVRKNGHLVLEIKQGRLVYRDDYIIPRFNNEDIL